MKRIRVCVNKFLQIEYALLLCDYVLSLQILYF